MKKRQIRSRINGLSKPSHGEKLMIRRVLLEPKKKEEGPWLRKLNLRTKCLSKGKCHKIIIVGGSTNNSMSTGMVDKLNLKCFTHPNSQCVMVC